ncbi:MAG: LysR family transcriptional regulator [Rhodospirillum sp.]|nr:LysR family transcriptional regulator [Rhodospirillum sp.]MCF8490117.1 LysR family transcriptional regulator [Rhodospirillum sp.]
MNRFNWNDIRYFLAVAQQGTLTGAARVMGTDHGTVSRRVQALESTLGARLFERTPQGYFLTPRGETLLAHAESMEAEVVAASQALGETGIGLSGTVRLTCLEGLGNLFLAQRMGKFSLENPRLRLEFVTLQQITGLSLREGDVAISLSAPKQGQFTAAKLTDYALGLYATEDYLARHGTPKTREDLRDHSFIGYVADLIFTRELDYLDEVLPGLKARVQSSSLLAQREMTEANHGLCVLPHYMTSDRPTLVPVLPNRVELVRSYWLFSRADFAESLRVKAVTRFVKQEIATARDIFLPRH